MLGLRRHIPELAIEWALDEPDRLWRAVDGTLCFADISGFTALSEKLARRGRSGGEELVETLSRVFGGMLDRAHDRDGMLLKFGGDALLLLFTGANHALRAASSAVEMRQALRRAREIPTSVGPLALSMSVGLHSGPIHFFLVGSTHRELVLAGPAASIAVATESAARAGEIGVSEVTAAALPPMAVRARDDGLRLLVWRKAPIGPGVPAPTRTASADLLRQLFPLKLGHVLERGPPEPEHRVACIAFVRFSGTDAMLQRDGPDVVAAALDATIGTAQRILATEDVTLLAVDIDKDGGKLFLGSGVPQATEDDEGRMLRALRRLARAGTPLPLQCGVNRGYVFAAEVGTPWRAAYSAMGDTTNTAARICAKAPAGEVYAHPTVLARSRTPYLSEPVGPFTFKGKKAPQILYRVGEEAPVAVAADDDHMPLVGRRREIEAIDLTLDEFAKGAGGVISIVGGAGLGKTRLLRAALERLDGLPVWQLRAEPYGTASPYRVFRDPVREILRIPRSSAAGERELLLDAVSEADPALLPYAALLGEVLRIEAEPSAEVGAIDPKYRQDRVADTVIRLLESVGRGPRVIVMEDAHWADSASAHLLERLARACLSQSWLLIVTRRADDGGFVTSIGRRVELDAMPDSELAELVITATASAPLRPHELDVVVKRASGNPRFAAELVRAARQVGSFDAVPDSLEAAIAAQVDALDPVSRRVLRYASILGRSFSRRSLEELLRPEQIELDDATLLRLDAFMVPEGEEDLRFKVGMLRDTLYEGLAFRLRSRLHREAGLVMERLASDPTAKADVLAMHFAMAGDHERTFRYACIAADRAAKSYANADAARLYHTALDAARKLPGIAAQELVRLWTDRGHVCRLAGLFDDALDAYREAHRLLGNDPLQRAELLRLRALARDRAGAFAQALRELTAARRELQGVASPQAEGALARLASLTAMIRVAQERYRDAIAQGLAAAELARKAGDREALAEALVAAGSAELFIGSDGGRRMQEALQIYQELGMLSSEAMVRGNIGAGALIAGRWDEALQWFEGASAAELRAGNPVGAACVASNRGEIYAKQGRFDAAEPLIRDAVRVMRASGFHEGAAYAEIQLGRVLVGRGAAKQADELLERVGAELTALGQKSSALEAALVQSRAKIQLGEAAAALRLIERVAGAAEGASEVLAPQAAECRAAALASIGRYEEAIDEVSRGLGIARRLGLRFEEGTLLRTRANLCKATGRPCDESDVAEADQMLAGLGVVATPGPA
jgi:class 3 adenylate cyclase/tetratricopeptide (TPR) repeat protein